MFLLRNFVYLKYLLVLDFIFQRSYMRVRAWAVIERQIDPPPVALIGENQQGAVEFCQSHYRLSEVPEELDFFYIT